MQIYQYPGSLGKTEGVTQIVLFLGVLIDSKNQVVSIPLDKRLNAMQIIKYVLDHKKVLVRKVQQLTGTLNHVCKGIVPGRAYTRQIYRKFVGLKQHHHAKVDKEMISDCEMWLKFLRNPQSVNRPFLDFKQVLSAEVFDWYTDASGNSDLDCGGHFNGKQWFARK